jgi:CHAD domain-containing protein
MKESKNTSEFEKYFTKQTSFKNNKRKENEKKYLKGISMKYSRELKKIGRFEEFEKEKSEEYNKKKEDKKELMNTLTKSQKQKLRKNNGIIKKDPYAKSKMVWEEKLKEKETVKEKIKEHKLEIRENDKIRKKKSSLLTKKNSKGQPVLKYQIFELVKKIEK